MYRRRHSPYSRIEQIRESRAEVLRLVLAAIVLGLLLSLLAAAIYNYLLGLLPSATWQWLAFILGVVLSLLVVGLIIHLFHSRGESQTVRLEVAIPYHLVGSSGLEVATQHPYRPAYHAAIHAHRLFSGPFKPGSEFSRKLRQNWEEAKGKGRLFQAFMASMNAELVDALILSALHRYGTDSLGPAAKYGWWRVRLEAAEHGLDDLPQPLLTNRFLQAEKRRSPKWKLLLPRDVQVEIVQDEQKWEWSIRHSRHGSLAIYCHPTLWVAKQNSLPGRVLGEGLKGVSEGDLFVLVTRLEATVSFRLTFLSRTNSFHEWATGLLAHLEEALDWGYFLVSRPDRMIVDLPWKIGDLPRPGDSVWGKLCEVEERLETIETGLDRLTSELHTRTQPRGEAEAGCER